ncbi:MAG TPA: hypothetical protein VM491_23950 [Burkholderiaceae bacterium]|nr:hypothetical protein [Burkholderiaceae bacterium]
MTRFTSTRAVLSPASDGSRTDGAEQARFNSPDQVEAWARVHGVAPLRALVAHSRLDPLSRHFAQTWLRRLEADLNRLADAVPAADPLGSQLPARRSGGWW